MDPDLLKKIDALEEAHQRLKVGWLDWAYDRFPDHGIGADNNNSNTLIYIKTQNPDTVKAITTLLQDITTSIQAISSPSDRYLAYREIYYIHPSFHERWFFDDHIHYLANILFTGRHGFGLNSYLSKQEHAQSRLDGITTFSLKRAILLENILSGRLKTTLFDHTPISEEKIPEYHGILRRIADPHCSPEEITALMPQVFEVIQTLLMKTDYRALETYKMLSMDGWLYYAPCSINEGPIFTKISMEPRTTIFSRISATGSHDLHAELARYYDIQIVRTDAGIDLSETIRCGVEIHPQPMGEPIDQDRKNLKNTQGQIPITPAGSHRTLHSPILRNSYDIFNETHIPFDVNVQGIIYKRLREELDPLFGKSVIPQKRKFTYRGRNEIGYPKKTELDMISLFKPLHQNVHEVRFRIYPYVLASHIGLTDVNGIFNALPAGSVEKREPNNPHQGAIFIEGSFSDTKEVERFVKWLIFSGD